jgi:virginiamycin B lyase
MVHRDSTRAKMHRLLIPAAGVLALTTIAASARPGPPRGVQPQPTSADWLSLLPDGEEKRRFILDCTGCHQLDERIARIQGRARTEEEWRAAISRMLGYAGATTGFPVISAGRDPATTAAWLHRHLSAEPRPAARPAAAGRIREFLLPEAADLPHDVAVDSGGRVLVTGMFSHTMYTLDTLSGRFAAVPIPVERANPRAVEVDGAGRWWVVLGGPNQVARYDPRSREWASWEVGMYAHSVAIGSDGHAWVNGHFTRAPELVASIGPAGELRRHEAPPHPALAAGPGGPIPYELRAGPDGAVWMSELAGNRLLRLDPGTGAWRAVSMPVSTSGPRRFDVDPSGVLWIPAYADNALVRYDPRGDRWERIPLPLRDAAPYVARVDRRGRVWVGTGAGDAVYRYDPATRRFQAYPLPSRGAMVRHLAIAPSGEVWVAYGASPGIPARIARIQP